MKVLNNLSVKGVLELGQYTNADIAAMGTAFSVGSLIYNLDNQQIEKFDGTGFVAHVPPVHPEVTIDTTLPESAWLTTDSTQVLGLQIPAGGITATHLQDSYYTQADVDQKFSDLVGGADAAYDTLQELATEIQNNDTDLVNVLTEIGNNDADIAALQTQAHDAVSLSTSSAPELQLNGQELHLDLSMIQGDIANVVNQTTTNTNDIAALQAQAHDAVTLSASSDSKLTLSGQELTLTLFNDVIKESFAATAFVAAGNTLVYSLVDSAIEIGFVKSILVLDSNNQIVYTDYEVKSGQLDIIVNAYPNNAFDGSVVVTLIEQ